MDTRSLDQMLTELRSASAIASGKPAQPGAVGEGTDFAVALKSAIDQVGQAQQSAQQMSQEFAAGSSNVNLQDVMVNLQKANISFQQMVQVRNKLVSAYHDIMNMQV
ncbi:MAG: flagellar hook-basal body complex protein FliE [Proteobacteria bacterium]|nr:flagellar hook-basal body complex protein FliE [Pseudomonadota bacterium]